MTTISYLRMFWYPPPVVSAATVSPWQEGSCHPLGTSATHVTDRPSLPVGWALGQDGKRRTRGITAAVPRAFARALLRWPRGSGWPLSSRGRSQALTERTSQPGAPAARTPHAAL